MIGGAKVSTKIPVLTNLAAKVDKLIIGGGMANTFLLAQGVDIGKSLAEPDLAETALEIMHAAKARSCEIVLPHDVVVAAQVRGRRALARRAPCSRCRADQMILDVGPEDGGALRRRARPLQDAAVERPARRLRDRALRRGHLRAGARGGALTKAGKLISVAGGGDTVAALNAAGVTDEFTYVSTAGGAFLNGWRAASCRALRHWPCRIGEWRTVSGEWRRTIRDWPFAQLPDRHRVERRHGAPVAGGRAQPEHPLQRHGVELGAPVAAGAAEIECAASPSASDPRPPAACRLPQPPPSARRRRGT